MDSKRLNKPVCSLGDADCPLSYPHHALLLCATVILWIVYYVDRK